ncbi:hypothetical protein Back11_54720 [Paenibacillus baekrokdamisoli]|uniref:Uncharacterized protein n=1 Tax=Paenibacillus baekrokdamisoli TaxID=1712516 RepID=A0A3G9IYX2_9BACL|nr:hypothetical protein [Paenibacillus baekrokdamisoli]MBB3071890.1 hypothetical protein [Paenibacillus baekrokdamisoli]BBH24127.1 hypothetical protein Back11_54720 [Paenibacillus baekrokdamisoli]
MKRSLLLIMTALVILSGCADAKQISTPTEKSGTTTDHNENKGSKGATIIKEGTKELTPYVKTTQINNEDVTSITVRSSESDHSIDVPKERYFAILDGLYWLDEGIAKADEQEKPTKSVAVIRVETKSDIYEIPYDLATNRLQIEGDWIYAYDYTLLIMHSLLAPESDIGKIDTMLEEARIEFDKNPTVTDTHLIDFEANVNGKDYNGWDKELKNDEATSRVKFYETGTKMVNALSFYTNGIIALNRQLLFTDPKYKTQDGIHVGMPREKALKKLGEPNVKLASHWGYKVGDYIRFHLYFEKDTIKWISLSMPL